MCWSRGSPYLECMAWTCKSTRRHVIFRPINFNREINWHLFIPFLNKQAKSIVMQVRTVFLCRACRYMCEVSWLFRYHAYCSYVYVSGSFVILGSKLLKIFGVNLAIPIPYCNEFRNEERFQSLDKVLTKTQVKHILNFTRKRMRLYNIECRIEGLQSPR